MFNCESIASFPDYDECLNTIIPLFVRGGIHIPDYQTEMLVSRLITAVDRFVDVNYWATERVAKNRTP